METGKEHFPNGESMDLLFLFISSVSVSVDGFSAGAVIGSRGVRSTLKSVLSVGSIVAVMCFIACALGERLEELYKDIAILISGGMLFLIGLKELLKIEKQADFLRKRGLFIKNGEVFALGLGVGADGACASLSLSLSGYGFYPVLTVGVFHVLFVFLGVLAGRSFCADKISEKAPSLLLIALGLFKLFS